MWLCMKIITKFFYKISIDLWKYHLLILTLLPRWAMYVAFPGNRNEPRMWLSTSSIFILFHFSAKLIIANLLLSISLKKSAVFIIHSRCLPPQGSRQSNCWWWYSRLNFWELNQVFPVMRVSRSCVIHFILFQCELWWNWWVSDLLACK